jgi:hypothetical protein
MQYEEGSAECRPSGSIAQVIKLGRRLVLDPKARIQANAAVIRH